MNNRYEDSLEYFALDVLRCSLDDLNLLKQIYSGLAEVCHADVTNSLNNLNEMLELTYNAISQKIGERLEFICGFEAIEVIDREGNQFITYNMTGRLKEDLLQISKQLQESKADCSDLQKPLFNNYLDNIDMIDFDEDVQTNLDMLVQWLFDHDKVTSIGYEKNNV